MCDGVVSVKLCGSGAATEYCRGGCEEKVVSRFRGEAGCRKVMVN